MKKNLTTILSLVLCFVAVSVFAQTPPANDDCSTAVSLTIYPDEASAVPVIGTTVDGTASTNPTSVCSGSWFNDDVWYSFTTGATLPQAGLLVKVGYGTATSVGMALYAGCGAGETPIGCFSDCDGGLDQLVLFSTGMMPNTTYYARVWSGCSANANSGTFDISVYELESDNDPIIWGLNGEGEFNGGLNGWTTTGISDSLTLWVAEADATSNGNLRNSTLSSPSGFNGVMLFDADFFNNDVPSGAAPPYPNHTASLTSPVIDASMFPPVSVKFYQNYNALNGETWFDYSLDGGATWQLATGADIHGMNINETIDANESTPVPSVKKVYLPGASGSSQLVLKFTGDMDYYNWLIDDVQLVETEANNMRINDFVATGTSISLPVGQGDDLRFLADIENIGALPQTNVNLNVTVVNDATSAVVYNQDLAYGTITTDSIAENQLFPMTFTPDDTQVGSYTATYTLSSDSTDFDASDNTFSFDLNIIDTLFTKNTGIVGGTRPTDDDSYTYGTSFYVKSGTLNGEQLYATNMQFGCSNITDMIGKSVDIFLYEWDDVDGNLEIGALGTELFIRTLQTYTFTGGETDNVYISVPMEDFSDPGMPYPLQSNTNYILAVQYSALNPGEFFFLSTSNEYNYEAADFAAELSGVGRIRQALDVGNTGDLNSQFGGSTVPALQMNAITLAQFPVGTNEVGDLPKDALKVFPSPATDYVNVDINLENLAENVAITVYDINGKLLQTKQMSNVKQDRVTFNVTDFAAGRYLVNITADNGTITKFFTVVK